MVKVQVHCILASYCYHYINTPPPQKMNKIGSSWVEMLSYSEVYKTAATNVLIIIIGHLCWLISLLSNLSMTNFDSKLIVLFKLLTKGQNVVKLTEIAYIPLYTSIYLLIPMKPQNKICTAVREGSSEYPHKLLGQKISTLWEVKGQRLKIVAFLYPYQIKPYNIPRESPFFKLQDDVIYFTKWLKRAKLQEIK